MSNERKGYWVTIRQEGSQYIARDDKGTWRAKGLVDRPRGGRDLAEYLFHANEIGEVESLPGLQMVTRAFILEG